MTKVFKEEIKEEKSLSKYLESSDEQKQRQLKYLIEVLGDVPLDEDMMDLFHSQFRCFGGKYSVRTKPETIQGIYEYTRRFKELSKSAIDEIWFRYIKDLHEEYDMPDILDKYFQVFGKTEEAFWLFIDYVDKKADEQQIRYKEEAKELDELKEEYSERFIEHLKYLITSKHFKVEDIKKCLPSADLIKKDEQHIYDLSAQTRIYFGCCEPVSYTMVEILIEDKTLDTYTETPTYYISTGRQEQATFTKTDFLESIKKEKVEIKIKI